MNYLKYFMSFLVKATSKMNVDTIYTCPNMFHFVFA